MKVDVLLIHPPANFHSIKRPAISPLIVGYGMLYIASCLLRRGYSVTVWNLEREICAGVSQIDIERSVKDLNPSVVGIELNWANFSIGALQTAEILKKIRLDLPVIVGGTHATLFATDIVQKYPDLIDAVLKGEAEKTFPSLVEGFEKTGSMKDVGGLVTLKEDRVHEVPRGKDDIYTNVDDISPYSYRLISRVKPDSHQQFPTAHLAVNTCRGPCNLSCAYCIGRHIAPLSGRASFSIHSPAWIIEQMMILSAEGATGFLFQDYLSTAGKNRLLELTRALKEEHVCENVMGINMTGIPGFLDAETLENLSRAGVYNIDYGAESGSDRILSLVNRPTSRQNILDAVKTTVSKGIIPYTWWMTGFPDEKPKDVKSTLDLMSVTTSQGAIPRWVTPLNIYPGTDLYQMAEHFGIKLRFKSFEDFAIFSALEAKIASWYPEAVSHETKHMNTYDIIRAAFDLRFEFFKKTDEIVENFMSRYAENIVSYHPQIPPAMLEQTIKEDVRSLLTTFL